MFPKLMLRRAYHIVSMNEERDFNKLLSRFEEKSEESPSNIQLKACIFIVKIFLKIGYTQETLYKVWESIEDGSIYDYQ